MKNDIKVLTIGNSFTDSLKQYFKPAVESAGGTLTICYANHGGCELRRHWEYVSNEERDPEYNMYGGKKLRDHLASEKWDYVTIQQASHHSWRPETYQPYADCLIEYIRRFAPSAEILIQQTWAYRPDDPRIRPGGEWHIDQEGMYERLTAAYTALADHAKLRIIPAGYAIQLARREQKEKFVLYDPELLNTLPWPDLPPQGNEFTGKIYWTKNAGGKLIRCLDAIHLNERGRYIQACVWFAFLTGRPVSEIKFIPQEISDTDADFLRNAAQRAVIQFPQVQK